MPGALADTPGSTPPARGLRRPERDSDSHAEASEEGGYDRPDQVGHNVCFYQLFSAGSVQATIEVLFVYRYLTCQWMTSMTKMFSLIGKSMQVRYVS